MQWLVKYRRLLLTILIGLIVVGHSSLMQAAPTVYTWGSYDSSGSALGFQDENGNPLPTGSVVQLIWVGANGRIDPPQAVTGDTSLDDQLIELRYIPIDTNYPPPLRNKGYLLAQLSYDTEAVYNNGFVYMRAWNAAAAGRNGGATAYGDSDLMTISSNGNGIQLGIATNSSTGTAVALASVASQTNDEMSHLGVAVVVLLMLTIVSLSHLYKC